MLITDLDGEVQVEETRWANLIQRIDRIEGKLDQLMTEYDPGESVEIPSPREVFDFISPDRGAK